MSIVRRTAVPPALAGPALAVALAALLPIAFVAIMIAQAGGPLISALVFRPRVGTLLVNTALLVGIAVPLCVSLALGLAWLTERSDLPGARLWAWAFLLPLAIPAFVQGYAWATVAPSLNGLPAGLLVSVLAYFPFVYLPAVAALRRIDPAFEDAAASLGLAPWAAFRRAVLPQLRVALCGGGLLVGLHLLAEYGLFVMIRFDTFTTAIVDQFQSSFNGPAANMLAGVLVLCCLLLLRVEAAIRGGERHARGGSGAPRPVGRRQLGRATFPILAACGLLAAASVGVPLVTLGRWLVVGGTAIWQWDSLGPALGQTVVLALAGGLLTTLAALPAAWMSVRLPGSVTRIIEGSHTLVGALPGVVVALGLVTFAIHAAPSLYQTTLTLLLAYAVLFLPRALIALRGSIALTPIELERVAASLGRSPVAALLTVTLRIAAPGAAAGAVLVALGIANELTATQMLAPNGTRTLAMAFWALSGELDYAAAAPYALIMMLVSLPLVVLLRARFRPGAP
ncbi:ABC transporter permease [Lichenifustis flavocetrariae]|uniref:Iron ABC transporter permease n=1 Tax=Lichenifustis flavocetrariae TaxID=2949735 RepID=A0AA41Z0E2_9HYPH|nr:iron ABC transporter permease [Lichenifustis flavocetrariae]MCW6510453.1 iron ABC transporter permease [Lichenifustis flavocetrariae]